MLPYAETRELAAGEDRPADWAEAWREAGAASFVLESGKDGRYTFLGLSPCSLLEGTADQAVVTEAATGLREVWEEAPLAAIRRWLAPFRSPRVEGLPKFAGGCVGMLGYDVARSLERLPEAAADDLGIPMYSLVRLEELWVIDHQEKRLYAVVHTPWTEGDGDEASEVERLRQLYAQAGERASRMLRKWEAIAAGSEVSGASRERRLRLLAERGSKLRETDVAADKRVPSFSQTEFEEAVRRIQAYIAGGDVFQVNLSVRQSLPLEGRPEELYEWLRLINPSPYMGLLRLPGFQLVSGSPELLVSLNGTQVSTRPIAGTRPRGADAEEDERLARELLANEKERAEHIMLVDLERNDLGRISRYGSVRVDELMVIERYSHVMHLVSEVRGELADGRDAFDVIAATFPGGTITGAPKIRTMEIIEELEPVRRGPYTGSVGWIDYNGNMDLNIVIRTLLVTGTTGHVQAGAGIVIDSDPSREYAESIGKAKAIWKAIGMEELERLALQTASHKGDA
nr:anthranilate synthase component I family protein [Paenibacillus sp. J31TS4]